MNIDTMLDTMLEKVVTDVSNKLSELNTNIIDNGNLNRNHLNVKGLHLNDKGI